MTNDVFGYYTGSPIFVDQRQRAGCAIALTMKSNMVIRLKMAPIATALSGRYYRNLKIA
jgi:hypothetical protein